MQFFLFKYQEGLMDLFINEMCSLEITRVLALGHKSLLIKNTLENAGPI